MQKQGQECQRCLFYNAKGGRGECRLDPPRTSESGTTRWPVVDGQDWCGEFEEDPQAPRAEVKR